MVEISVIVPVYGCSDCLKVLHLRLTDALKKLTPKYEIIYIDDHSLDGAWIVIQNLNSQDNHAKGIKLSRNFGQHHAITAGIDQSQGKWVVVMDCDLQDPPEDIPLLYKKALAGYDTVFARRMNRQDNLSKKITSFVFHTLFARISGLNGDPSIGNFGIYSRRVIDNLKKKYRTKPVISPSCQMVGISSIDCRHYSCR